MKRKQFTFYYSFYDVIQCIEDKVQRADAYDAVCAYALLGENPNMAQLSMGAKMVMKICKPILSAANKKASAGMKNAKYSEDAERIPERSAEADQNKNKNKDKNKIKDKIKDNSPGAEGFERFWQIYPKKVGKTKAKEVFAGVDTPVDVLINAICRQSQSQQWLKDGGSFIPNPATWLRERRWEDEVPVATAKVPMGASGELGQAELDAIRRMMAE